MVDLTEVTLETVSDGAAVELFQRELQRVLENIQDPNTNPEKKRRIRLDVAFHPDESRSEGRVTVKASSKLAPSEAQERTVHFGEKDGRLAAAHYDPAQLSFGQDPSDDDAVHPIDDRREA
jgi:hypothetical protein